MHQDTVVLFEDEFSLSNTATLSHTWAPVGEQPVIPCKQAKRERVTGFGSINPLTGRLTVNFADKGNYLSFKKHLKKLLYLYRDKAKIIVYVDNVRFHHAKLLKKFLADHPRMELRYLPAYSPDLNPVERVWWYMRKSITHNRYLSSLKERIAKFWRLLSGCLVPNNLLKNICVINY
jgi:transposase